MSGVVVSSTGAVSEKDPNFEVLTVGELRRRYREMGITAQPIDFDEREVPPSLKHLIPLAHVWGIRDDLLRDDMRRAADPATLKELKALVYAADDELEAWLISPEELSHSPSDAYVAFTNLTMVADSV
jgi:hypothetical protein